MADAVAEAVHAEVEDRIEGLLVESAGHADVELAGLGGHTRRGAPWRPLHAARGGPGRWRVSDDAWADPRQR